MKARQSLIVLFLMSGCLVSCEKQNVKPKELLSLEVHRDSITDFFDFLEGIKLMLSDQPVTLRIPGGQAGKKLMFRRLDGFPGDPFLIHVTPESVFIGSGPSRELVTLDELRAKLSFFNAAARAANCEGILLLIADQKTPGDFGLSILELIADSGIKSVMLSEPDMPVQDPRAASDHPRSKPPSPPSSSIRVGP